MKLPFFEKMAIFHDFQEIFDFQVKKNFRKKKLSKNISCQLLVTSPKKCLNAFS